MQRFKQKIAMYLARSAAVDDNSFTIGDCTIKNLRLLQRKNSDTLGKVGMLSWVASMDGSKVKVYECRSVKHAKFIEELSNDERISQYLPKCLFRKNEFVIVEWVEGRMVTWKEISQEQKLMSQMSNIHSSFHSLSTEYWPAEKCYLLDYFENRFNRFRSVLPVDEFVDRIFSIFNEKTPTVTESLSHPDITPVNVIVDRVSGEMKVIDNDLFTQSSYYLIDIFTTYRSIGIDRPNDILKKYLSLYIEQGGELWPLVDFEDFFQALWCYRVVGTCLQEGNIQQALDTVDSFLQKNIPTHPVIQTIKHEKLY